MAKIQSKIPYISLGMAIFLMLSAIGCGYRFAGKGDRFPKDVQTVFVEPFINKSREIGIEAEITTALRSELFRQGQLRVVDRPEQSDAILSGVVRSWDRQVASVNRKDEVLQFETTLVVDVSLRRRAPDEILWRTQGTRLTELHSGSRAAVVTTSSDFKTGTLNANDVRRFTDVQLTETDNQQVREELITRFARELHQRLVEMF